MKIHKEGRKAIFYGTFIAIILAILSLFILSGPNTIEIIIFCVIIIGILLLIFFYRHPNRHKHINKDAIMIPADGKIVVCERVFENTYFKKECMQVSIFMSVFNVHVNWIPASGTVVFKDHKDGENYPAYNPKSSHLNERCCTVIRLEDGREIMLTQIAGLVARRVINQVKVGDKVKQGDELGIIKFGSRVDIHLPIDMEVEVEMEQNVRAMKTILAKL
ncbi:MAG: phosphatidylserine decarboxylase family protein [Bacteroidales bacterium]|jgi:phosphatidylserine decarboxylase|nr:phosphatidylserine decarboxylase family protein [Bacteroidales bacterium]